ncbi:unnamed protein product [Prorocentrum cordatum]|uniref:Prolyl 4-hydroxylase alpha subunit Fe(2+) 2OG dioxygenase domain-containing protein n=1 Tax=Prorocentrum cordatum TaxID=2364126 RepID=A0ABN9WZZ1_9DINO|nr:unnamed protein product [Polarella glacialis]
MVWTEKRAAGRLRRGLRGAEAALAAVGGAAVAPRGPPRGAQERVWELSEAMLRAASARAAEFDFSAIAVSKMNFHGSPHVDKNDLSVQYAVSLGDFADGSGRLCVEEGPFLVRAFDTKEKLVCIDGRFPHWVSGYTGERYSIIYP